MRFRGEGYKVAARLSDMTIGVYMRSAVPHWSKGPRAVCAQSMLLKKRTWSVCGSVSVQSEDMLCEYRHVAGYRIDRELLPDISAPVAVSQSQNDICEKETSVAVSKWC
jgi:hypothetical protein